MICPNCSTANAESHKFCHECGRPIAPPAAAPTDGKAAVLARPDEAAQALKLVEQAFEDYDAGRYEDALASCQAALVLDPTGSTAHSLLGMIYERQGKTAEAVQHYQMVLAASPGSVADSVKLDELLRQSSLNIGSTPRKTTFPPLSGDRRATIAGAGAAAVVLVAGFLIASHATGPSAASRRVGTHATQAPVPGAALPRQTGTGTGMPGAEESLGRTNGAGTGAPSSVPQGIRLSNGLPAPPSSNTWPALRGAYPPTSPTNGMAAAVPAGPVPGSVYPRAVPPRQSVARRDPRTGYLAPAPIQGVERLNPQQSTALSQVPGATLPAYPGVAPQRPSGGIPVLPPASVRPSGYAAQADARIDATLSAPQRPVPAAAPPATAPPPALAPPPSASISIQPLDDSGNRDATRGMRQSATSNQRAASLSEAMQHQRMAAYYQRQGDHQAARDEYQYAHDLFRSIQQRGGREGAIAAEGAATAQAGLSRQ
jgi:tetratricopeptide (TPR) repeat protein